jgi:hypothetical protein
MAFWRWHAFFLAQILLPYTTYTLGSSVTVPSPCTSTLARQSWQSE